MQRIALSLSLLLLATAAQASTLRCEKGIVSSGDRTTEVTSKCGEPVARDMLGYTLDANGNNEFLVEEWLYGPRNGMNYYLRFEGGRLKSVESKRGS
jgi:hypothetical protein